MLAEDRRPGAPDRASRSPLRRGDRLPRHPAADRGDARGLAAAGDGDRRRALQNSASSSARRAAGASALEIRGHESHSSLLHTGVSAVMEAASLIDWMAGLMAKRPAPPRRTGSTRPTPRPRRHDSGGTATTSPRATVASRARFASAGRVRGPRRAPSWPRPPVGIPCSGRPPGCLDPLFDSHGAARLYCRPAGRGLARALTGDNGSHPVSYQTEAGHFQARGLPTVICGPGSIAQAPSPTNSSRRPARRRLAFVRRLIRHLAA